MAGPRLGQSTVFSSRPFAVNPDSNPPQGNAVLTNVRVATHSEDGGFDRIVFEFKDSLPGAEIEYVDEAIACGSGQRVPSPSSAILLVRFQSAQAHDEKSKVTAKNRVGLFGPALLQAMQVCDFEGELTWALAVNGKLPFPVTMLKAPPRLVVDIRPSP